MELNEVFVFNMVEVATLKYHVELIQSKLPLFSAIIVITGTERIEFFKKAFESNTSITVEIKN